MGTIHFFEENLRTSEMGEPGERDVTVNVFTFESYVHLRMASTDDSKSLCVLLSQSEGRRLVAALEETLDRLKALGER